jgi:hypothetical protein
MRRQSQNNHFIKNNRLINFVCSWTSPEGELISFTYIADENGYQPQGSHIPQNVQPIHPALQRGLDLIARVNGQSK